LRNGIRFEHPGDHDLVGEGQAVRQFVLKTFRRSVFERGSRTTHKRDPGKRERNAVKVPAIAVGWCGNRR